ncbi:hypothetical protein [Gorillibacterium timonense]|uniref:hypothetical protein n=1 Tax=Gorillibacterium timonense TaxID=1689269 RepID=UPI00071C570C|nr:hypothetical protein [Gorillibacterium timonense]
MMTKFKGFHPVALPCRNYYDGKRIYIIRIRPFQKNYPGAKNRDRHKLSGLLDGHWQLPSKRRAGPKPAESAIILEEW